MALDAEQVIKTVHIEPDTIRCEQVPGPASPGGTNLDAEQVLKNVLDGDKIKVILIT